MDSRSKLRLRNQSKPRECWIREKEWHFRKDRHEKKNWKASDYPNVSHENELSMILTATEQDHIAFHIAPDKNALFDFTEIDGGKILMGNNIFSEVKDMGKLKIINSEVIHDIDWCVIHTNYEHKSDFLWPVRKNRCKYEREKNIVTFYRKDQKVILGKISWWILLFAWISGKKRSICSQSSSELDKYMTLKVRTHESKEYESSG